VILTTLTILTTILWPCVRRSGGIFNSKPKCDINFFQNRVNLKTSSVDFFASDKPKVRRISAVLDFDQFQQLILNF